MALHLPFDSSRDVSSGLALLFVVILSAVVGWMTVSASAGIIRYAQDLPKTSLDKPSLPIGTRSGR